ncbi:hypothetical protein Acr_24g0016930 [Actinidia rufa]|uniref:Uncharacterized protein n=1 Tax=Actinidia rufa TaxID=165716 RepID=A0A7J0GXG3_9ERIC|nr:hypothetical protein Acr_24g0016930 [Actinidia rufa]
MSFRITPSNPPLPWLNLDTSGPEKHKMPAVCMLVPAGLAGLIIIAMGGKGLGHMFLEEHSVNGSEPKVSSCQDTGGSSCRDSDQLQGLFAVYSGEP